MKSPYSKISQYQLLNALKSATHYPGCLNTNEEDPDLSGPIGELYHGDYITLPNGCEVENVFVVYERLPIFQDILRPGKSVLIRQLLDRTGETALVADSVLSGKAALFFASVVKTREEMEGWIRTMNESTAELTIRQIDNEHKVIISPFTSFVRHGVGS